MSSTNFWDTRFGQEEFVYGREPNAFLAEHHLVFPKGARVLSLGEGEGRNAVFLARQGYDVTALDSSEAGMRKLSTLASQGGVLVSQRLEDMSRADLGVSRWNGIVNIFAHLPFAERQELYVKIRAALKGGGVFLSECFSPRQLDYESGGPRDANLLIELDELLKAFEGFEILLAEETGVTLDEGPFHQGPASVIRFVARKPVSD